MAKAAARDFYSDADGDADNSTLSWTIGGVSVGSASTLTGVFSKGDTVTCTVTPDDGFVNGSPVSASLVIDKQSPRVTVVDITPDPADSNADLTVTYSYTDADGDGDQSLIQWEVDKTLIHPSITLPEHSRKILLQLFAIGA